MKKLLLIIALFISINSLAQEGTKQFMPNSTDRLWLEFYRATDKVFGTYDATDKERLYVYLNAGEKMHFGMRMAAGYQYDDNKNITFRIKDPSGTIVYSETQVPASGAGFISSYNEAITGPDGVVLNGTTVSGGYSAYTYTAATSGNHYIEYAAWRYDYGSGGNYRVNWRRFALSYFDVTVTDASNIVLTNPGEPNRSAGRLWSKGWGFTTTSYTLYPVKSEFFVFTADEFVNKVQYEMKPYSFNFVANSYGVNTNTSLTYVEKAQSQDGDLTNTSDISEYRIFLNDPDRSVWPNTTLPPPSVKVWVEETLIYDYKYDRSPQLLDVPVDTISLEKNRVTCPYSDITMFKIESSVDGFTAILLDIDGGGYSTDGNDKVLYLNVKKGLNYVLWNFRDDNGNIVPNGHFTASATFLGRGPAHFPLYDVESLSGISTSSIRPFNKLGPTLYWDDTQISDWGDPGGAMVETSQSQLIIENHIPRVWIYDGSRGQHNGNLTTLNSWFNAIDLGLTEVNFDVSQSLTKCVNGGAPYVADIYMYSDINTPISFSATDFDEKYFDPNNIGLDSIAILSLPSNGDLELNGFAVNINDSIARAEISNLTFTPDIDWNGMTNFAWKATNGLFWSLNQDTVYLIVNTDPTISTFSDTTICTNTSLANLPFTVGDAESDPADLNVIAYSHDPAVVPNSNITLGGFGANRTITITPPSNTSGYTIIYVKVDDGLTEVIEEFALYIGPSMTFTGDTTICVGNPLELSAIEFGADSYSWEFDGTEIRTTQDLTIDPFTTDSVGVYSLTIQKDGCAATRDINVSIAPITTFNGDTEVCIGEDISLSADETVATLYSWKKGGVEIGSSKVLEILTADVTDIASDYSLEVTKEGCNNTSPDFSISVIAPPSTNLTLINDTVTTGMDGVITVLSAESGVTYNAYIGTTLVGTGVGSGSDLNVTINGTELSVGNNIIIVKAQNANCELENSTNTNVFVRVPGISVSAISGNTNETGTTATFTIVLDAEPTANVIVGISSGDTGEGTVSDASVTFTPANWDNTQIITVTGINDDIDDGNQTYTIITTDATSTDGNYSGMVVDDVTVINEDDADNAGITVSALSNNTEEDGTAGTFTIVLDSEPTANVTIALSSDDIGEGTVSPASVTFTSANWDIQQTVTVTGVDDDLNDGDQSYNIITADATSTDGNYSAMLVVDIVVTNIDDDAVGVNISAISGNTTEAGGIATFTVSLASEPYANVTINLSSDDLGEGTVSPASVTFTSGNWNILQTVTVTGVDDDLDDGDQPFIIVTSNAISGDSDYSNLLVADVAVTNVDNDNAGVSVSAISGNTSETGTTATFTIVLDSEPTANVTIGLSSDDTGEGTVLPASVTFTSGNWNVAQTVTVTGVDDDIEDGDQTYNIITAAATSTDGNYSGTNPSDVVVINNDDTDAAGITVSAISGNTSETGTTATFTIVLDSEPTANVTIGLSSDDLGEGTVSPASVTFTSGNWNVAQTVTVTGVDDDIEDGNQTYNIITAAATSADGNYSGIDPNNVVVINNDDTDAAGITVSAISGNTSESGTTATFTIVLDSEPTANVTINLTSDDLTEGTVSPASVTFTPANWDELQTVTVTGVNDASADGDITYNIITSAATSTDGNYSGMNANDVTVINVDGDVASINVSIISGHTAEDGTFATFTIVLTSQPTANVTIGLSSDDIGEGTVSPTSVTFDSGDWNIAQTITVTGVNDDIDDGNQSFNIITAAATSTDGDYSGINADDVSVINDDDGDAAGITVSAISGNTTEAGGQATFTIVLDSEPTANVTIGISSDDTGEGTVLPVSVTFTAANWDVSQTATVTGVDDDIDDGDQTYNIITAAATSTDGVYSGLNANDVVVINDDNDVAGITISAISGNTSESGVVATFTVVLDTEPTANVTIGLSSDDTGEGTVLPASMTFTAANWDTPQTITVTGVDDDIDDGDQTYNIITAATTSTDGNYSGMNANDVVVTNIDDDISGITVTAISGNTTETGTTATFTIVLDSEPTANVTIGLSSDDTGEGTISSANVIFTPANWNIAQTIIVTGVNDDLDDGDQSFNIITAAAVSTDGNYSGVNANNVAILNIDDDNSGITVSTISKHTNEDGTTATFTIVLDSEPTANVTIGLSSDDIGEGTLSAGSVTFTAVNWNIAQTITVTGVDDDIDDGNQTYNIITAAAISTDGNYGGVNPNDVVVINDDDGDVAGITISAISGNTTESGGIATFTIVLDSEPLANVTMGLSSDDLTEGTVSPASVTFTSGNWSNAQTITVTGVNDDVDDDDQAYNIIIAAANSADGNYNGTNPTDVSVINEDDDEVGINVTTISNHTTEAGGTATFSIVLESEPTSDVIIGLSSDDTSEGTIAIPSITFTDVNWNTAQIVTVTGVNDDIDDGDQFYNIVTASAASADVKYAGRTVGDVAVINDDDDIAGVAVSLISGNTTELGTTETFTIVLNSEPTADVIIGLTSDDLTEGTVSDASVTFTSANWDTPQTITVTGVNDDVDDDNQTFTIITADASTTDIRYSGLVVDDVTVINVDDDNVGITVSVISGNTTELGTTETFTLVLDSEPTADVIIGLTSDDLTEGTVSDASITFTSANWDTPQTIIVTGVNDNVDDGDIAYSIVTANAVSTDLKYSGTIVDDVSVTNEDDDTVGFTVSETGGSSVTSENGSTDIFTVVLDSEPLSNVVFNITVGDATEGSVDKTTLTFIPSEWNIAQTVTITGLDDVIIDLTQTYSITVSVDDPGSEDSFDVLADQTVSVNNTDNDAAGVTISSVSNNTIEDGTTANFTLVLNTQPIADVTISLVSNDISEGTISPNSITFTSSDWDTEQTIIITGINDNVEDGNQTFDIITNAVVSADGNYNGLNPDDISVINEDDDNAGITVSVISGNTTEDLGQATFTVVLDSEPTANVTIGLSSDNLSEGTVLPANLVFNNTDWNIAKTVTVTGVNDDIDDDDITFNIITAVAISTDGNYNGIDPNDVVVVNEDNDNAGITVSAISNNTSELGTTATFSIVLNTEPTDDVTIGLTSDDLAEGTIPVSSVTFNSTDWNIAQTITVTGIDDNLNDGDVPYNIITAQATSLDGIYSAIDPDDVAIVNLNDGVPVAIDDNTVTDEGDNVNIDVLANDTGIDDGGLVVTIITQPLNGTLILNGDNTITYKPNTDYYGSDSFIYEVCDFDPECDQATVNITINPVNDHIPIALDDSRGTSINTPVDVDVLVNDKGLEDGGIVVTVLGVPSNGTAVVNGDNSIKYTPNLDYIGSDTFDYQVCDMDGECATATVNINVKTVNANPVAVDDILETIIDQSKTINVLSNDSGLEDGGLKVSIYNNPPNGFITINPDNTITYTPNPSYIGVDSLEYMIEDVDGDYAIATIDITVIAVPDYLPVAVDDARGTSINSDVDINVLINDTGLEDGGLVVTITGAASNGTATVNPNNTVTYSPNTDYLGTDNFEYQVCDADGDCSTATVTITVKLINTVPSATNDNASTLMNNAVNINVLNNDSGLDDGGITVAEFTNPANGKVVVNADNTITYTPNNWYKGNDSFKYVVSDAEGDQSIATVNITITEILNYVPVAVDDARGTSKNSDVIVDVLFNDSGLEDGGLVMTITSGASNGTANVNGDNTITYSPNLDYLGSDSFDYQVCDIDGECSTATVTITVKENNVVPDAIDDNISTVMNSPILVNVLSNDTDLDDGGIVVSINENPSNGTVVVNGDNTITYTPYNWYQGSDSFKYMVEDAEGDYDIATVFVTINEIPNYIPNAIDDFRGTSVDVDVIVDVLTNDLGLEDGIKTFTVSDNPSNGTVVVNVDNTITYTPDNGFIGTDVFEYEVCDNDDECSTAEVTINVHEINHLPNAYDDKIFTNKDTEVIINVLENDFGLEDGLQSLVIESNAVNGSVIVNPDNTVSYTPESWFEGTDNFSYRIVDLDGDYDIANVEVVVMTGTLPKVIITGISEDTKEDGTTTSFTIVLTTQPTNDVNIDLNSNDITEGIVSTTSLTFTDSDWNQIQTITITGQDDLVDDGDINYDIITDNVVSSDANYNGLGVENISVINIDNDTARINVNVDKYETSEDLSNTSFDIVLNSEPVSNVEIEISSSDDTEGDIEIDFVEFTSSNWNVPQTVNVIAQDDEDVDGDIKYNIEFDVTTTDIKYAVHLDSINLTNIDNDVEVNDLDIPEAFSPDDDNYNQLFEIIGLERFDKVEIKIFNRWGSLVYEESDYKNNWDGKTNVGSVLGNEDLPTGTYFYLIKIVDENKELSGYIYLKR